MTSVFIGLGVRVPLQVALVVLLFSLSLAQARPSVVIYPFFSQEGLIGTAVADRAALALEGQAEVYGPAVTPLLVPPLATGQGYVNPVRLLGEPYEAATVEGVRFLRETLGADVAVGGELRIADTTLELSLSVVTAEQQWQYLLRASQDRPGVLAAKVALVITELMALSRPEPVGLLAQTAIDLSTAYGDYVRGLAFMGAGFPDEAAQAFEQALEAPEAEAHWGRYLRDIRAVQAGNDGEDPVVTAIAGLSLGAVSDARAARYFERMASETTLPAAQTWLAVLRLSAGDTAGAEAAFEEAAARYPYGRVAHAFYLSATDPDRAREALLALQTTDALAAAYIGVFAALQLAEPELERVLAIRTTELAPGLTFGFEHLSYLAFDANEPLLAAQALSAALTIAPESDLYWTNLGWSYYLLGFLERSEEASRRAIALDPDQVVAWYNLGLVEVVTGRLTGAMQSYHQALLRDDVVNAEAIEDLEEALLLYPQEPGVHFALGSLYQAANRRQEAMTQFEDYLARGADPTFLQQAAERLEQLSAPPSPIFVSGDVTLSLGPGRPAEAVFHPGDRVYPNLELATEGAELPAEVTVDLRLLDSEGNLLSERSEVRPVPINAIAYRLRELGLGLPVDLPAGPYTLEVSIRADERSAEAAVPFEVRGEASLLRQVVSRGIELRELETGRSLLADLQAADADLQLIAALRAELALTAELADEVLPVVSDGRFAGLSGAQFFTESTDEDVRDFLRFLIAQEGAAGGDFTFVDLYAQWVLEGAPAP